MQLKVAVYNMEWMKRVFTAKGKPVSSGKEADRSARLAEIVKAIDPDFLGIVEGPDTTASGNKTASRQMAAWARHHGLDASYKAVHGFPSAGQQELCALYKSNKIKVEHKPEKKKSKNPFNVPFIVDTTESLVKEQYRHYRPPLELSVKAAGGSKEIARIIVAHTKSKGIFDNVDMARFEQLSHRNRKRLYAECASIRKRCDQWLNDDLNRKVIVMGDINDGAGMDYYERRLMRSSMEVLLGDVWEPDLILRHILPQPKLNKYGWVPFSSKFKDRFTRDRFNVLIDHILVSGGARVKDAMVWNPKLTQKNAAINTRLKALKHSLLNASDHFPVSAVIDV